MYTYIYGLKEIGKDKPIKYIGKSDNPKRRKYEHITESKTGKKTHKCNWIRKLLKNNKKIECVILEKVYKSEWQDKEREWISKYYKNLVNNRMGGEGGTKSKYLLSFNDLKTWVKKNLKTVNTRVQWFDYWGRNNRPEFIPYDPYLTYQNRGWTNWGDFLGSGNISSSNKSQNYLSYDKAKEWIKQNLTVSTSIEWNELVKNDKIPNFIAKRPCRHYENKGWVGWLDFLSKKKNTRKKRINYLPYNEAKEWLKDNLASNINSVKKWKKFNNYKETKIPTDAYGFYKKEGSWVSWNDFLNKSN